MKKISPKLTGIALALAAGGIAGCATSSDGGSGNAVASAASAVAITSLVECHGVNKCGGHNDCKTANNACAGHASCKGKGFVKLPAKACDDVGGEVRGLAGTIATADLTQCHGVNKCGGHNDCKTAANACAGHASCKGQGFVKTSAKACDDLGGQTS